MALLALIAIAAAQTAGRVSDDWAGALEGAATLEIPAPAAEADATAERAQMILSETPGIASARRIATAGALAVPSAGTEGWALACRLTFSLAAGHWPLSPPPAHVAEVLSRDEFAPIRKSFEDDLAAGVAALLRGLARD